MRSPYLASLTFGLMVSVGAAAGAEDCTLIPIHEIGHEKLTRLQSGLSLWLEMDQQLLACDRPERLMAARGERAAGPYWTDVERSRLLLVRDSHPGQRRTWEHAHMLGRGGPYSVILADSDAHAQAILNNPEPDHKNDGHQDHGCARARIQPITGSQVLARQSANAPERVRGTFGPAAEEAANAVDGDRWLADVTTLAGWNRHTHGSEIAQARDWLVTQMNVIGLTTSTPSFSVSSTTAYNVMGRYDGTTRPNDWFIVGAHYDSTSQNPSSAAPGAEDNASGCAGVLEMARVLVPRNPEATIFFICYSGEEQGLWGSEDHAGDLVAAGDGDKLQRVLTMDMIGYTGDADLDVLLETTPAFASTLDALVDAAAEFTTLRSVTTLNAFGSDHIPYLNRNLPAQLTIENDWNSYPSYHRTTDVVGNLSLEMGKQTLRMNAAVLAQETGAGSADNSMIFSDGFESGNTSAWTQ